MPTRPWFDPPYRQAMLEVTAEQAEALNTKSRQIRARAAEAVEWSRRLRVQYAALVERIDTLRRSRSGAE